MRGTQRRLIVTGEESAAQVRLRADRIGALHDNLFLAAETDLAAVLTHIDSVAPTLLIVDSVQTISSSDIDGVAGGVTQVRQVAATLIAVAKERGIATVLVGHVTKDGSIAGPRVLEHLVDVVLSFEGDRHPAAAGPRGQEPVRPDRRGRLLRAHRQRHPWVCPTRPGCSSRGTPSPVPGTCVTVTLEGRRPLVAEVQAPGRTVQAQPPRRAVSGLDSARVAMVLAVVERRGQVRLGEDVYTATVGGVRLAEPAADLALGLAVAGAAKTRRAHRLVAVGEVGLAGEVRPVSGVGRRLAEAARLGFTTATGADGLRRPTVRHDQVTEVEPTWPKPLPADLRGRPAESHPARVRRGLDCT